MCKQFLLFALLFFISQSYSQELVNKIVKEKGYEIKIPKDWDDKNFSFDSMSLMVLKPKTKEESNPVEAIGMKHVKTDKSSFNDAYLEYIGLLEGYYKQKFKILEESIISINGVKFKKLIVETQSRINGENRKNMMYYTFINNESYMMTLMSTEENFNKYKPLYDKVASSFKLI